MGEVLTEAILVQFPPADQDYFEIMKARSVLAGRMLAFVDRGIPAVFLYDEAVQAYPDNPGVRRIVLTIKILDQVQLQSVYGDFRSLVQDLTPIQRLKARLFPPKVVHRLDAGEVAYDEIAGILNPKGDNYDQ